MTIHQLRLIDILKVSGRFRHVFVMVSSNLDIKQGKTFSGLRSMSVLRRNKLLLVACTAFRRINATIS